MPRVAYVNGRYVDHRLAAVHIEDRGYQFADGVYEVIAVHAGRLIDEEPHLERLDRSLSELAIAWPMARRALKQVARETVRRNRVVDGLLYIQITRGVARRDHAFPAGAQGGVVMSARPAPPPAPITPDGGVAVVTRPDIRWRRVDIKSVSLLANVLGKQHAVEAGAYETWLVDDDGYVTEGTSSNAWIVDQGGAIVTRPLGHDILGGITRQTLIKLAGRAQIKVAERAFTPAEAVAAKEAFLTSSSSFVKPVIRIDGAPVGDGAPGPLAQRLMDFYLDFLNQVA